MKYSSSYINSLSFKDYLKLMAKELNEHGFRESGHEYEVFEDEFMRLFMMGPVNDPKAMAFLKEQGLLENGRCPSCGAPMSVYKYYWSDTRDPSRRFYVCYGCSKTNGRGDGHSMDGCPSGAPKTGSSSSGSGCMVGLFMLPATVIANLLSRLLN